MQIGFVWSHIFGYTRFMKQLHIMNHPHKGIIEYRVKIMAFFDQYGSAATRDAFGVGRSTVYLWKQKLKASQGKLIALSPRSKAPRRRRQRMTDPRIILYITQYRRIHPGVSKETIKSPLDEYCLGLDIASVSESTIGRVITDLKYQSKIPTTRKISFYARTDKFVHRHPLPRYQKLRRKNYQPEQPGELIQIDAITVFSNGLKR